MNKTAIVARIFHVLPFRAESRGALATAAIGRKTRMRTGLIGTMVALATASTPAQAADYGGSPSYAPYVYRWTGPYVGGNLGYRWGTLSNSGARPSGIAGGGQGGYSWQFGALVVGAEADLQFSNASDTFANYKFSNPWFGTVRGRAGYAMNNILYYATLGLAYGRGHVAAGGLGEDNLHGGWVAGGGLGVGLTQSWSVRAEYLYIDLGSEAYNLTGTSNELTTNLLRFGLDYRF
jgi:outer membrane immunogenic protein